MKISIGKDVDPFFLVILSVFGFFAAVTLIAFIGVFIMIPLGIGFAIYGYFKWKAKPARVSTAVLEAEAVPVFPSGEEFASAIADRFLEEYRGKYPPYELYLMTCRIAEMLYDVEELTKKPLAVYPPGSVEEGRYRDRLIAYRTKAENAEQTIQVLSTTIFNAIKTLIQRIPEGLRVPEYEFDADGRLVTKASFSVPIIDVIPDIGQAVTDIILPFYDRKAKDIHVFDALREQFSENQTIGRDLVIPTEFKGTPRQVVETFLGGTPFDHLFDIEVPFALDTKSRLEHWHLLARTGHGKSQTLQHIIYNDLISEERPTLVIVDSQGEMLNRIARLKIFDEEPERLIVIDPQQSPALNIFAAGRPGRGTDRRALHLCFFRSSSRPHAEDGNGVQVPCAAHSLHPKRDDHDVPQVVGNGEAQRRI